jgi:hypothetical protein
MNIDQRKLAIAQAASKDEREKLNSRGNKDLHPFEAFRLETKVELSNR